MKIAFPVIAFFAPIFAFANGMQHDGEAFLTTYPRQVVITVRGDKAVATQYAFDKNKTGKPIKAMATIECKPDADFCDIYWGE